MGCCEAGQVFSGCGNDHAQQAIPDVQTFKNNEVMTVNISRNDSMLSAEGSNTFALRADKLQLDKEKMRQIDRTLLHGILAQAIPQESSVQGRRSPKLGASYSTSVLQPIQEVCACLYSNL